MKVIAIEETFGIEKGKVYSVVSEMPTSYMIRTNGRMEPISKSVFVFADDEGRELTQTINEHDTSPIVQYLSCVMEGDVIGAKAYYEAIKSRAELNVNIHNTYSGYVALPVLNNVGDVVIDNARVLAENKLCYGENYKNANMKNCLSWGIEMRLAWNILMSGKLTGIDTVQEVLDEKEVYAQKILSYVPPSMASMYEGDNVLKALKVASDYMGII